MAFSASPIPPAKKQFCDANGVPLAGGSVGYYVPGTLTPKLTWQDEGQVTANANPITLDAAGRAIIFGSGDYREIVKDQFANTIWDSVTNVAQANSGLVTGSQISTSGNVAESAWTTSGARLALASATFTDTTSVGTILAVYGDAFKAFVIAATNITTFTNAYGAYFEAPQAGANVTLTNVWALGADSFKCVGPVSLADIIGLGIRDTSAAYDVTIGCTSSTTLTAGRELTIDVANAARTLKLIGNTTLNQDVSTAGSPSFAGLTVPYVGSTLSGTIALNNSSQNILSNTALGNQSFHITAWAQSGLAVANCDVIFTSNGSLAIFSVNANNGAGLSFSNNGGGNYVYMTFTGNATIQYTITRFA